MAKVILNGSDLTLEDLVAVARDKAVVALSEDAKAQIIASRKLVDKFVEEERVVYGINTGFGSLSRVSIPEEDNAQLQENLIRTHSSGYGNPRPYKEI